MVAVGVRPLQNPLLNLLSRFFLSLPHITEQHDHHAFFVCEQWPAWRDLQVLHVIKVPIQVRLGVSIQVGFQEPLQGGLCITCAPEAACLC